MNEIRRIRINSCIIISIFCFSFIIIIGGIIGFQFLINNRSTENQLRIVLLFLSYVLIIVDTLILLFIYIKCYGLPKTFRSRYIYDAELFRYVGCCTRIKEIKQQQETELLTQKYFPYTYQQKFDYILTYILRTQILTTNNNIFGYQDIYGIIYMYSGGKHNTK